MLYCRRNTGEVYRFPRATDAGDVTAVAGMNSGENVIPRSVRINHSLSLEDESALDQLVGQCHVRA